MPLISSIFGGPYHSHYPSTTKAKESTRFVSKLELCTFFFFFVVARPPQLKWMGLGIRPLLLPGGLAAANVLLALYVYIFTGR